MTETAIDHKVIAKMRSERIRCHLCDAKDELIEAVKAEDWRALGYVDWETYWVCEFGDAVAKLKLSVAQRREIVGALRQDGGPSTREIAGALGVSQRTVMKDVRATESKDSVETVIGKDGKRRAAHRPPSVTASPVVRGHLSAVPAHGAVPAVESPSRAKKEARRMAKGIIAEKGEDFAFLMMRALESELTGNEY